MAERTFNTNITGLSPATKYYMRAYLKVGSTYHFSNQIEVTTTGTSGSSEPTLNHIRTENIDNKGADFTFSIADIGNSAVTSCGIELATNAEFTENVIDEEFVKGNAGSNVDTHIALVGKASSIVASDQLLKTLLESFGNTVTYLSVDDGDVDTVPNVNTYGALFLSQTMQDTTKVGNLKSFTGGIITDYYQAMTALDMTLSNGGPGGNRREIDVPQADRTDLMFKGITIDSDGRVSLTGSVQVYGHIAESEWGTDANMIGYKTGGGNPALVYYDKGDKMANDVIAAGRRILLPFHGGSYADIETEGEKVLENAANYGLDTAVGIEFSGHIESANSGTKYYYRGYATNSEGTGYSVVRNFTTTGSVSVNVPGKVTIKSLALDLDDKQVITRYRLLDAGSGTVTDHGIIASTKFNPTLTDDESRIYSGKTLGLNVNVERQIKVPVIETDESLYIRAYITTSVGTTLSESLLIRVDGKKGKKRVRITPRVRGRNRSRQISSTQVQPNNSTYIYELLTDANTNLEKIRLKNEINSNNTLIELKEVFLNDPNIDDSQ